MKGCMRATRWRDGSTRMQDATTQQAQGCMLRQETEKTACDADTNLPHPAGCAAAAVFVCVQIQTLESLAGQVAQAAVEGQEEEDITGMCVWASWTEGGANNTRDCHAPLCRCYHHQVCLLIVTECALPPLHSTPLHPSINHPCDR